MEKLLDDIDQSVDFQEQVISFRFHQPTIVTASQRRAKGQCIAKAQNGLTVISMA